MYYINKNPSEHIAEEERIDLHKNISKCTKRSKHSSKFIVERNLEENKFREIVSDIYVYRQDPQVFQKLINY